MGIMRTTGGKLKPLLVFLVLMGCAAAVSTGAGCRAYAEMRMSAPWEALRVADPVVVRWFNLLDARMAVVC